MVRVSQNPVCAQVVLTLGVVVAQMINTYTGRIHPWGWRLSLGLAGVPAAVLTLGGLLLPDTPNSLIERGFEEEGRAVGALPPRATLHVWRSLLSQQAVRNWLQMSHARGVPSLSSAWRPHAAAWHPHVKADKAGAPGAAWATSRQPACIERSSMRRCLSAALGIRASQVLQRIRGTPHVDAELADIKDACVQANLVKDPWRQILQPAYRPQLFVALTAT